MKVLVTGAGGFIGSHVVEQLLRADHSVEAFFQYGSEPSFGHLTNVGARIANAAELLSPHWGDLTDRGSVDRAVKGKDAVLHLGAMISVPHSFDDPESAVMTNTLGTLNVLEACRKHKPYRVVVTSSSEVYGSVVDHELPIKESHPMKPQSPYAASKVAGDALAYSYYCSYELPVVILRPFNTYGPRQSDRAVIPNVIKQALWSDKIEVGALTTLRDFTYVEDTARAFVLALQRPQEAVVGQTIQLGTGTSHSVADICTRVLNLLQKDIPIESVEYRKRPNMAEVTHLLAAPYRAAQLLDWRDSVSFDEGLKQTIDYIQQHPEMYDPERYNK